jgi:hypothetical protein
VDAADPRRTLLFVAAGATLGVAVFTLGAIAPVISHLKAMLRRAEKKSGKANEPEFSTAEADEALLGVNKWMFLNRVRILIAATGWAAATAALVI